MNIQRLIKLTSLSLLVLPLVAHAAYAAPAATPAAKSTAPSAVKAATGTSLGALKKVDDAWKVLENPIVKQSMKSVMGNKYKLFEDRTQGLDSVQTKGDEIFSQGGVEGLYTIQEGAFSFNTETRHMQVALLDNDDLSIWGAAKESELSPAMKNYIADLQSRKGGSKTSLSFEVPNQSTIAAVEAPKAAVKKNPKQLNLSSPTGTYERKSKWDDATLQVVKLPGDKIKFGLSAEHAANTGEASGIIELKNNKGVYKADDFQLVFQYNGKSFSITKTGEGMFGGMNVYADGLYKKSDDKTPKIED